MTQPVCLVSGCPDLSDVFGTRLLCSRCNERLQKEMPAIYAEACRLGGDAALTLIAAWCGWDRKVARQHLDEIKRREALGG